MRYLGIDTSNYATSAAVYDFEAGMIAASAKLPLEVKQGSLGLRQSDAVFLHNKNIPAAFKELAEQTDLTDICAVGVSSVPRDADGSYMPCFLAGLSAASAMTHVKGIPLYTFSHQAGHVMAALYGTGFVREKQKRFFAFHLSGGTTDALLCSLDGAKLDIDLYATSLDLFAGQAVDRVGNMLGLPFPAGEKLSELARDSDTGDAAKPVLKNGGCCLSGLENQCQKLVVQGKEAAYIARYCLNSIADTVIAMIRHIEREKGENTDIICAGGVMSSIIIREKLKKIQTNIFFCEPAWLSADNAVGTAILAARSHELSNWI